MMKEMYNNYKKDLKNKNNILLVISVIFILGLIFGSIYITILKNGEKTTILNEVGNYFLSNNKLNFEDKIDIFKNELLSNLRFKKYSEFKKSLFCNSANKDVVAKLCKNNDSSGVIFLDIKISYLIFKYKYFYLVLILVCLLFFV